MSINLTNLPSNIGGVSVPDAVRGPLSILYGSKYDKSILRYPRDLGTNPARKHSIVFTIRQNDPKQMAAVTADMNTLVASFGDISAEAGAQAKAIALNTGLSTEQKLKQMEQIGASLVGQTAKLAPQAKQVLTGISEFLTPRLNRKDGDTIGLYIPDNVNVTYSQNYDSDVSLSKALGRLYFLAQGATSITQAFKDQKDVTLTNMINVAGNDPYVRDVVSGVVGGQLGMNVTRQALNAAGYATNPQIQVLFRGIGFRSFQFDFVFTPYNKEESTKVKQIIEKFKYHAAPKIDPNGIFSQGLYMQVPDAFDIKFYYGNEENKNIHKIGECVLENINVDYSGSGQWATFNDGSPNQIRLTLQFKETIIIDKNRINQGY